MFTLLEPQPKPWAKWLKIAIAVVVIGVVVLILCEDKSIWPPIWELFKN